MSLAGEKQRNHLLEKGMENQYEGISRINAISIAVGVCGIFLLIFGMHAYESTNSDITLLFSGSTNADQSIWMLISGIVVIVAGTVGVLHKSRSERWRRNFYRQGNWWPWSERCFITNQMPRARTYFGRGILLTLLNPERTGRLACHCRFHYFMPQITVIQSPS